MKRRLSEHLEYTLMNFNIPNKQIDIDKVLNVYIYGSYCYETNTIKSDFDYIIIYEQDNDISETIYSNIGEIELNATLISPKHFQEMLNQHRIDALECYFLKDEFKYETINFVFNLDLDKLRRSISATSSNSWVKTKKKILQGDNYIGKKSLFHSLRIADFGIQIAKEGKIVSYTKPYTEILLNKYDTFISLLNDIMIIDTWEELKEQYQKIANNLRTEFRRKTNI